MFGIRYYNENPDEYLSTVKVFNLLVVYATDCYKDVILVLFVICVWLCGFNYEAFHYKYCQIIFVLTRMHFTVLFGGVIYCTFH